MSLFFQNPALLGLLALAGVPLLVHLLSRTRPPEYRFSNTEFLKRVIRRTARFRRPKDWLLLALRTVAVSAIALAFALPFLFSGDAALPGEKTTAILVIDRSGSMAAREGAGSRFETACAMAADYLEKSKPGAANLVWIDSEPDAAFPEPGPNLGFLTETLQKAVVKPETGALGPALDLALRQLSQVKGRREVVVFSDFQSSAWKDFRPATPPGIKWRTHSVATSAPANLAVTRLLAQPANPVAGQETTLLASVRNFSPDALLTELTVDADGSRQSRTIDLPPWGETEASFTLRPATAGPLPVTASIGGDSFPADDSRHLVPVVLDSIRIASEKQAVPVIERLAAALPWLESGTHARPGDLHAVSTWSNAGDLRTEAENGVTVLVHDPAAVSLTGLLENADAPSLETSAEGWQILPVEDHPANQLFRSGDFGNPYQGKFRERLRLSPDIARDPAVRLIANYADGVPAIFEIRTGKAPVLFFNLSLDAGKSDWPSQGVFLPAFAEILLRTRPDSSVGMPPALPGSFPAYASEDSSQGGIVELLDPAGTPLETRESTTADGLSWQSSLPAAPGIYRWQVSGQNVHLTAVNFPEAESDLRPMEQTPVFGGGSSSQAGKSLTASSEGAPFWPWLLVAAVLCLLAESFIQFRPNRPAAA